MTSYKQHLEELLANSKGLLKKAALDTKKTASTTGTRLKRAYTAFKEETTPQEGRIIDMSTLKPVPPEEQGLTKEEQALWDKLKKAEAEFKENN